jgi:glycosyltransferase involved in cell wall biosynthesis
VLQGGRIGPLVDVGDAPAMAAAIAQVLERPLPPAQLMAAVSEYSVEQSAARYLQALGVRI